MDNKYMEELKKEEGGDKSIEKALGLSYK